MGDCRGIPNIAHVSRYVYANADLTKASQAREVLALCDHWKTSSGHDPQMVIMDQKVITRAVLGELDERRVKFLTLRMRSPALMKHIDTLTEKDFKTVTLNRPGKFNRPKVSDTTGVRLTGYHPGDEDIAEVDRAPVLAGVLPGRVPRSLLRREASAPRDAPDLGAAGAGGFPAHPNWAMSQSHFAFWELSPRSITSCRSPAVAPTTSRIG